MTGWLMLTEMSDKKLLPELENETETNVNMSGNNCKTRNNNKT